MLTIYILFALFLGVRGQDFNWTSLEPSTQLKWVPCYGSRQCTRFQVPLDYANPDGDKAALAVIRIPAAVPPESNEYRGPLIHNPGGPGISGVTAILGYGDALQSIVGNEYDIVSFDPRGIGHTTPNVNYLSWADREVLFLLNSPVLNSSTDALPMGWALGKANSKLAERSRTVAEHASTPAVARDMLAITEAHNRPKLSYWGISYGSALGATFAAMFPDKVERLVVDGVLDPEGYYDGTWLGTLADTDKVLEYVYDACAAAGPECPLHEDTAAAVKARVERIFDGLKQSPLPVVTNDTFGVVTFSYARTLLLSALYDPFHGLKTFIAGLAAAEAGDGTGLFTPQDEPQAWCGLPDDNSVGGIEASFAIRCTDGEPLADDVAAFQSYYATMARDSSLADVWAKSVRLPCLNWPFKPKETFSGPFVGNTSFPLLLVGNTLDPVTPLRSAQKVAEGFNGAVVLTQNGPGHSSLAATSLCTFQNIRAYFQDGTLPPVGTVCEIEDKMYGNNSTSRRDELEGLSEEDAHLLAAVKDLRRRATIPRLGMYN